MLLLIIALVAGILTILAPCVLPVLPVIIGGSLGSTATDKKRPYIIAGSLMASVIGFTLLLKVSTVLIHLSPDVLTDVSGGIVIALGLVSVFPGPWEELLGRLGWQAKAQRFLGRSDNNSSEYIGPVLTGVALGPVFSTCSPTYAFILASVLPRHLASGIIYLIFYCIGLAGALLAVVLLGQRFIKHVSWAVDTHSLFRRITGVVFIIVGVAVITGWEVSAETWVANHLPFDEAKIEQSLLDTQAKNTKIKTTSRPGASQLFNVNPGIQAPELAGLTNWINSPPLQLSQLHGKVVLVDFWTYSCINCLRTLPYVEKWQQTYASQGFTVIGIHTPEFAFEHLPSNVEAAVKAHGLTYPIALDNDYGTWNAFDNNSWPADYLIDKQGNVRDVHLGEGDYDKTEEAIQSLLGEDKPLTTPTASVPFNQNQTQETYFGTDRTMNFTGLPALADGTNSYSPAKSLDTNQWTLSGSWLEAADKITSSGSDSTLSFHTQSKDVYVVAGSTNDQPQTVGVSLPAGTNAYGSDVQNGQMTVTGSRLYHIVSLPKYGDTTVKLTVPAGVSLYTFTFGS
jgi:cytochrome c biogenesis protein CcdA/thiol-disulfide isomerase/thioredoxin